jgi:hypothetical protein
VRQLRDTVRRLHIPNKLKPPLKGLATGQCHPPSHPLPMHAGGAERGGQGADCARDGAGRPLAGQPRIEP